MALIDGNQVAETIIAELKAHVTKNRAKTELQNWCNCC